MRINLDQVGKRYQRYWIFRGLSHVFMPGEGTALLGANGSGKSTLLRIIAGMQTASKGKVVYQSESGAEIAPTNMYRHLSFCAPGQELVEELSLEEFLNFHFSFKQPIEGVDIEYIIKITGLDAARKKPLMDYSSGMKQRVKLAQAIFTDSPVLLLDEPCTNLDHAGVEQYRDWMTNYTKGRTVIIASNDPREYFCCKDQLVVDSYK